MSCSAAPNAGQGASALDRDDAQTSNTPPEVSQEPSPRDAQASPPTTDSSNQDSWDTTPVPPVAFLESILPQDLMQLDVTSVDITDSECGITRLFPDDLPEDERRWRLQKYSVAEGPQASLDGPGVVVEQGLVEAIEGGYRFEGRTAVRYTGRSESALCHFDIEGVAEFRTTAEETVVTGSFELSQPYEGGFTDGFDASLCVEEATRSLGVEQWQQVPCPTSYRATLKSVSKPTFPNPNR
jgi:hypothetical protein